jgi:hypothetical protein
MSVNQSDANISVSVAAGATETITVGDNANLTVSAFSNAIVQSTGFVTIGGTGAGLDAPNGSHLEVTLLADAHLFLVGSINDVHLGADGSWTTPGITPTFSAPTTRFAPATRPSEATP